MIVAALMVSLVMFVFISSPLMEVVDGPQKGSLFVINEQGVDYLYRSECFERI